MRSPNPTLNNIDNLIRECEGHIASFEEYKSKEPMAEGTVNKAIDDISNLKKEWEEKRSRISSVGFDDEGEFSYAVMSYKASYAFVILGGYLKELRFELEKLELDY